MIWQVNMEDLGFRGWGFKNRALRGVEVQGLKLFKTSHSGFKVV